MIGTPCEILQYIDEWIVVPAELGYLVLDEAESMLDNHNGPEIHKIIRPLQHHHGNHVCKHDLCKHGLCIQTAATVQAAYLLALETSFLLMKESCCKQSSINQGHVFEHTMNQT